MLAEQLHRSPRARIRRMFSTARSATAGIRSAAKRTTVPSGDCLIVSTVSSSKAGCVCEEIFQRRELQCSRIERSCVMGSTVGPHAWNHQQDAAPQKFTSLQALAAVASTCRPMQSAERAS